MAWRFDLTESFSKAKTANGPVIEDKVTGPAG